MLMFFSLLVAFIITPWLALRVVKPHHRESARSPEEETQSEHRIERIYSRFMRPLIRKPKLGGAALAVVLFVIILLLTLVQFRFLERRVHYAGTTSAN